MAVLRSLGLVFVLTICQVAIPSASADMIGAGGAPPVSAVAFQDEPDPPTQADVLPAVSDLDGIMSPVDIVPVGPVTANIFANGGSTLYFDALSLEFDPAGMDLNDLALQVYLRKGGYQDTSWEHILLLAGAFNPTSEDLGAEAGIDVLPGGILPSHADYGWYEIPFDATSDPDYTLPGGNVALTLRLWNWQVDQVLVVPEPATACLLMAGLLAAVTRRKRRGCRIG